MVSAVPFQLTTEELTKLVPLTVRVNADPPTVAFEGESDVIVGTGLLIGNAVAPEVPPPGAGLVTVMLTDPVAVISLAGTWAVIVVPLTKLVVSAVPFHLTIELARKLVPFRFKVKVAPPTSALVGESEVTVGIGLLIGSITTPDAPPPGVELVTVMLTDPVFVRSPAGTAAVT